MTSWIEKDNLIYHGYRVYNKTQKEVAKILYFLKKSFSYKNKSSSYKKISKKLQNLEAKEFNKPLKNRFKSRKNKIIKSMLRWKNSK